MHHLDLDGRSDLLINTFYNSLDKTSKHLFNGISRSKIKFAISISDIVKYTRIKIAYDIGVAINVSEDEKINFNKRLLIKFNKAKREYLRAKQRINAVEGPIYLLDEPLYSKILDLDNSDLHMATISKILIDENEKK